MAVALDPHIDGRDAHTDLVRLGTSSKFAVATEITLEGWAPESEEEGIQHAVMGPKEVAVLTTGGRVLLVPITATEHAYAQNEDEKDDE